MRHRNPCVLTNAEDEREAVSQHSLCMPVVIPEDEREPIPFIQRDYVKWRGVLFLRFLPSLVDDSEKIRHLSDYLFGSILKGFYTLDILYHF
jgi:hypothetical protein